MWIQSVKIQFGWSNYSSKMEIVIQWVCSIVAVVEHLIRVFTLGFVRPDWYSGLLLGAMLHALEKYYEDEE